jgi:hypothetical protein
MSTKAVVPRLLAAALVAAVVGTCGGITFASATDTDTKAARVTGYEIVQVHNPATQPADITVTCPRGKSALSGGGKVVAPGPGLEMFGRVVHSLPAGGPRRIGWRTAIVAGLPGSESLMVEADFYAVCADI